MPITQADVEQYIAGREPEGLYLDFKRGASLTLGSNEARTELVKDCTGFANAAGGVIIYGVAEELVDGAMTAGGLDPVADARATRDWIGEVLRSNTSPPLARFHVSELPQPGGGRVVAIEIEAAGTAHQSLRDHKYYQRAGAATVPMVDFQIRDVMARRTKAEATVHLRLRKLLQSESLHRYALDITVENTGSVTLEKWWLDVDLPAQTVRDTRYSHTSVMSMNPNFQKLIAHATRGDGTRIVRVSYGDPWQVGERCLIHPGQALKLNSSHRHFTELLVEVDGAIYQQIKNSPIRWALYFNNSAPQHGEMSFDDWCEF